MPLGLPIAFTRSNAPPTSSMWWLPMPLASILPADSFKNVSSSRNPLWQSGLWALGTSSLIYVGLAAVEGTHGRLTNGAFSRALKSYRRKYLYEQMRIFPPVTSLAGRLSLHVVGLNFSIFAFCTRNPLTFIRLADSYHQNWTLISSAFSYIDSQHLMVNMASLVLGIPALLQVCGQSPYHFAAFYFVSAIVSSFAQHFYSYIQWL